MSASESQSVKTGTWKIFYLLEKSQTENIHCFMVMLVKPGKSAAMLYRM